MSTALSEEPSTVADVATRAAAYLREMRDDTLLSEGTEDPTTLDADLQDHLAELEELAGALRRMSEQCQEQMRLGMAS